MKTDSIALYNQRLGGRIDGIESILKDSVYMKKEQVKEYKSQLNSLYREKENLNLNQGNYALDISAAILISVLSTYVWDKCRKITKSKK